MELHTVQPHPAGGNESLIAIVASDHPRPLFASPGYPPTNGTTSLPAPTITIYQADERPVESRQIPRLYVASRRLKSFLSALWASPARLLFIIQFISPYHWKQTCVRLVPNWGPRLSRSENSGYQNGIRSFGCQQLQQFDRLNHGHNGTRPG